MDVAEIQGTPLHKIKSHSLGIVLYVHVGRVAYHERPAFFYQPSVFSALHGMQANCSCSQSDWSTTPAGGLSVFCLHSGTVFKIVFRGQKICLRYFKIGQTYFEICALYFLFAPMWGKHTENQFSFFPPKNARFTTRVLRRRSSVSCRKTTARQPAAHRLYVRRYGFQFQIFFISSCS